MNDDTQGAGAEPTDGYALVELVQRGRIIWLVDVVSTAVWLVALIVARMVIQRLDRVIALLEQGVG